ncbi:MAG TPA: hypothetical protein VFA70_05140 [Dehalococcoidia bacterium]|nr:hypothetical protein [Dehalococcoidia bacterium]
MAAHAERLPGDTAAGANAADTGRILIELNPMLDPPRAEPAPATGATGNITPPDSGAGAAGDLARALLPALPLWLMLALIWAARRPRSQSYAPLRPAG